jgi:aminoglycoside phosphotransferase (APT) family kinase protein
MQTAAAVVADAVPRLLGVDAKAGLFAMEYLDPRDHTLWKTQLRDGIARVETARAVAQALSQIHAATAGQSAVAGRFPTDAIFRAIRLDPYLMATARRHPDLAPALHDLVETTARTKRALVHGDVSPKNILIGPRGPVFLDAECAWYGDPAFDAAFCLNHLLLKCLWTPAATAGFLACYDAFVRTYFDNARWEPPAEIEARTARLLPGLFLARVDGKSPVEYVTEERDKDRVRRVAGRFLRDPASCLAAIRDAWAAELRA